MEKVFSILFISILFLSSIYSFIIKKQETISYVENRNFTTNDSLIPSEYISGTFQTNFEAILTDQFYNRYQFVKNKNKLNYDNIQFLYKMIKNPLVLNPIGDSNINQIGSSSMLMGYPLIMTDTIAERIYNRTQQINQIAKDFPNVDFYVYKPTQLHETNFFDEANGIVSGGDDVEKILSENLDVPYASFIINSIEDYPKFFYTTDHHWNNEGSYQGYRDILKLMFNDTVQPLVPLEESCKDNLPFYGTYSAQSGFVTAPSKFCVYRFDLPKYTAYSDGKLNEDPNDTNKYFYKTDVQNMEYHYNQAYSLGYGFVHLQTSDENKNNILIIGDSYGGPILPLLANNFDNVYFVYPINYKGIFKKEFTYDSFIRDNNIGKVLIMYTIENYFLSDQWGDRYVEFDVKRD